MTAAPDLRRYGFDKDRRHLVLVALASAHRNPPLVLQCRQDQLFERESIDLEELGNGAVHVLQVWHAMAPGEGASSAHGLNQQLQARQPGTLFGGVGQSGYGREMGFDAMREYTQARSVWVNVDAQIAPWYQHA